MMSGARTKNAAVAMISTVMVTVTTAEMASHASFPRRVVRWSTKTGTKVADNTPVRTRSTTMFGVLLARL
jgi:hypothetical protein